uniref:IPT/TIG domain-containing protein n=1 Tax=Palpitomonas bilix TaxID=652834 RepID=A0A7S3G6N6_9EUKA
MPSASEVGLSESVRLTLNGQDRYEVGTVYFLHATVVESSAERVYGVTSAIISSVSLSGGLEADAITQDAFSCDVTFSIGSISTRAQVDVVAGQSNARLDFTLPPLPSTANGVGLLNVSIGGNLLGSVPIAVQDLRPVLGSPSLGPISGGTTVAAVTLAQSTSGLLAGAGAATAFAATLSSQFGAVDGSASLNMSTWVVSFESPASESVGTVSVGLKVGSNSYLSSLSPFLYYNNTFSAAVTTIGGPSGGTVMNLDGSGFVDSELAECYFGSVKGDAAVVSATKLSCTSPAGSVDTSVPVSFSNNGQQSTSTSFSFTYRELPNVISLSPFAVPKAKAAKVTVTGANFFVDTAVESYAFCRLSGMTVVPAQVVDANTLICSIPASATKNVGLASQYYQDISIEVTTNGADFSSSGVKLRVFRAPVLKSIETGNVWITGYAPSFVLIATEVPPVDLGASNTYQCVFAKSATHQGDMVMPAVRYSRGLNCTFPSPGQSTILRVYLGVSSIAADGGVSRNYMYAHPPVTIVSFSPSGGLTSGDTDVRFVVSNVKKINYQFGTSFMSVSPLVLSDITMWFGSVPSTRCQAGSTGSGDVIVCTSPAGVAGDVLVGNSVGGSGPVIVSTSSFAYYDAPVISGVFPQLSPSSGARKAVLTLEGTLPLASSPTVYITLPNGTVIGSSQCTADGVTLSCARMPAASPIFVSGRTKVLLGVSPFGVDFPLPSYEYWYYPDVQITSASPTAFTKSGGMVTLTLSGDLESSDLPYFGSSGAGGGCNASASGSASCSGGLSCTQQSQNSYSCQINAVSKGTMLDIGVSLNGNDFGGGVEVGLFAPAPAIVGVRVTDDAAGVRIEFDVPSRADGVEPYDPVRMVLDVDQNGVFGEETTSVWVDSNVLLCYFGPNATLQINDTITLRPDTIYVKGEVSLPAAGSAVVDEQAVALLPSIRADIPSVLPRCGMFTFDFSQTTGAGGRDLVFAASVSGPAAAAALVESAIVDGNGEVNLNLMDAGNYSMVVSATNWLGYTSQNVTFIFEKTDKPLPTVSFIGGSPLFAEGDQLVVEARGDLAECAAVENVSSITYEFSLNGSPLPSSITFDDTTLYIPVASVLPLGSSKELAVVVEQDGDATLRSTAKTSLLNPYYVPELSVSVSDSIIDSTSDFYINYTTAVQGSASATVTVTCHTASGAVCNSSITPADDGSSFRYAAGSLRSADSPYSFTVTSSFTVAAGQYVLQEGFAGPCSGQWCNLATSSGALSLDVIESLSVVPPNVRVGLLGVSTADARVNCQRDVLFSSSSTSTGGGALSYSWNIAYLSGTGTLSRLFATSTGTVDGFRGSSLAAGARIRGQVTVIDAAASAYPVTVSKVIQCLPRPSSGSISISGFSGLLYDSFDVVFSGWTSDQGEFPLKYEVFVQAPGLGELPMSSNPSKTTQTVRIVALRNIDFPAKVTLRLRVSSRSGVYIESFRQVTLSGEASINAQMLASARKALRRAVVTQNGPGASVAGYVLVSLMKGRRRQNSVGRRLLAAADDERVMESVTILNDIWNSSSQGSLQTFVTSAGGMVDVSSDIALDMHAYDLSSSVVAAVLDSFERVASFISTGLNELSTQNVGLAAQSGAFAIAERFVHLDMVVAAGGVLPDAPSASPIQNGSAAELARLSSILDSVSSSSVEKLFSSLTAGQTPAVVAAVSSDAGEVVTAHAKLAQSRASITVDAADTSGQVTVVPSSITATPSISVTTSSASPFAPWTALNGVEVVSPFVEVTLLSSTLAEVSNAGNLASISIPVFNATAVADDIRLDKSEGHRALLCAYMSSTGAVSVFDASSPAALASGAVVCSSLTLGGVSFAAVTVPSGCDGVPFGNKTVDACGVCGGDNSTCADCAGVPNGPSTNDVCNVCDGSGTSCLDCNGTPFGTVVNDACGVCGGDNSSCTDCFGVINGGAVVDECGVCGGDNSTCSDCNNVPNGGAVYDVCGVCGGLSTCVVGTCPVAAPLRDPCGVCGGDTSTCLGCDGVVNSRREIDGCGMCQCSGPVFTGATIPVACGASTMDSAKDNCGVCNGTSRSCCENNGYFNGSTCDCDGRYCGTTCGQLLDSCDVCSGNNRSCCSDSGVKGSVGGTCSCDSGKCGSVCEWSFDLCDVCNGDSSTCAGCDGVAYRYVMNSAR